MPDPTREEAIALLRRGLDDALRMAASNYVMPICWIAAEKGRPLILGNGSAFMLDAGGGAFLVTANHVYEEYCSVRLARPDTVCLLPEMRFPLEERLIAKDPLYDVCTFKLLPTDIQGLKRFGKAVLIGSQTVWPPKPPQVDRGVFFVGFPGDGREMRPYRGRSLVEVDWTGYTALALASSVSETGITVVLEHDPHFDVGGRQNIPPDWALGGCSGAPLLTLVDHNNVLSWRLGGVIYESSEVIVKASRADCLNVDGTLNPYPDPNAYVNLRQRVRMNDRANSPAADDSMPEGSGPVIQDPAEAAMIPPKTHPMRGRDVPLPELIGLLRLCVKTAEVAIRQMRFNAYNRTDCFLVALLSQIVDYARGVIAVGIAQTYALIPGAVRSTIYAYVDIANLCEDPTYWKTLELADSGSWASVLEAASRGNNPFLQAISESGLLAPGRSHYAKVRKKLEKDGVKRLEVKERFKKAGLMNEHESAYGLMSADAHNNVSGIVTRYFEITEDAITLRQPNEERPPNYELPCTLLVSEILLRSTEKVLRHCGHGVAVLSEANDRFMAIAAVVSGNDAPLESAERS
jgi:Family of unknown function (DUF5677)